MGGLSIMLTTWVARRMGILDDDGYSIPLAISSVAYFPWLMWEIVKSNVEVARLILSPSRRVSPSVFTVTSTQKSDIFQVIYANSITLTPGTVTLKLEGDQFVVHALLRESIKDLESGEMDRRVTQLED